MTPRQLEILKHSFGFDSRNPGCRSHYCTEATDKNLLELVKNGYMTGPISSSLLPEGSAYFYLTDKAKLFLIDLKSEIEKALFSPKPIPAIAIRDRT